MYAIQPLPEDRAAERHRPLFTRVRQRFGRDLAPFGVTAHNPAVLDAMMGFEQGVAAADRLPAALKHLVNLKVAALLGCPFCIDIGSHVARTDGVTADQLRDLPRFRDSNAYSAAERVALEAAEVMTVGSGEFEPATWEALRTHFDDGALVELLAVVAWENYRSRFNRAAGLQAAGFCSVSERAAAEHTGS